MPEHMKKPAAGRVAAYEWLRLIATLFVVVGHSAYWVIHTTYGGIYYNEALEWVAPVYFSAVFDAARRMAAWVYRFHMPLFFCLSGAVLHLKPIGPLGPFVRKKARRLLVPYYVCGLVFMLPVKGLCGFYTKENFPRAVGAFLLGGDDSGHLWFLTALFWCMLVFALLQKAAARFLPALPGGAALPLLLAAGLIQQFAAPRIPADLFGFARGMENLFWFALGYAADSLRPRWEHSPLPVLAGGFAAVSGFWLAAARAGMLGVRTTALTGCVWSFLLALLCARLPGRVAESRWYRVLVRNLFYVYLFHDPLEYVVLKLFMGARLLAYNEGCWLYLFCRIFGVILAAVALGEALTALRRRFRRTTA